MRWIGCSGRTPNDSDPISYECALLSTAILGGSIAISRVFYVSFESALYEDIYTQWNRVLDDEWESNSQQQQGWVSRTNYLCTNECHFSIEFNFEMLCVISGAINLFTPLSLSLVRVKFWTQTTVVIFSCIALSSSKRFEFNNMWTRSRSRKYQKSNFL